ncbi:MULTISPECIES: hypothetical protein [Aurantimonas]|uniref:Uncharacterized protein n=1 Tax=Aurantimonas marianensis TaxID=2920428 RepID=A0A9X2KG65_9HYPH|nr:MULTISPECIES: hypothetical protein [Aurantimonas]MCP3056126.1 hypothetical protein [Aurantimonas marianensis]
MFKTTALAATFALAMGGSAFAQSNSGGGNNSQSEGLVNVTLGDVVVSQIAQDLNVDVSQIPVTVEVPVGVAANVCDVTANVLASDKKTDEGATCDASSSSQALTQVVQKQMKSQQ